MHRADISEWQPIVRNGAGPITLWALGVIVVVLSWVKVGRPPPAALAALVVLGYAAANVTRLVPLFGLAAVMLLSSYWPSDVSDRRAAERPALLVVEMVFVGITLAAVFPIPLVPTCVRLLESPYVTSWTRR